MPDVESPNMLRRVTVRMFAEDGEFVIRELNNEDLELMDHDTQEFNERTWRWSYLKDQFAVKELDSLFDSYSSKISNGYLSTFLVLLFFLMTTHFFLVLGSNMEALNIVTLDLILYGILSILPLFGLFVSEKYVKEHPKLLVVLSAMAFTLLFLSNVLVPIYHHVLSSENLRPVHSTLLIVSCYVFLHVTSNPVAFCLGLFVTVAHILILVFITYSSSIQLERLGSDLIYLICLNGFGLYFRLITEIIKMRSFLDRRACVESTVKLNAEKDQGERLMLSIIPKQIMEEVITQIYDYVKSGKTSIQYPFNNPHIKQYNNVTILYADIVNYTQMTSTLKSLRLVETLHDLFGRFDDASKKLDVQRIKFLGDCYYCVAGLSEEEVNHADSCVELGLRMIEIIQFVRESCGLDINMRIGVHSGSIIGGIIGTTKWQFDIWSQDVYIANRMETTGQAGKVHITKQTKDQLKKHYAIVPSDAGTRDPELKKRKIECFLISPELEEEIQQNGTTTTGVNLRTSSSNGSLDQIQLNVRHLAATHISNGTVNARRDSKYIPAHRRASYKPNITNGRISKQNRRRFTPIELSRRTPFMDNNLNKYHEHLRETDEHMKEAVENMPLSKIDQWFRIKEMNPFLLIFRNLNTELDFIKTPDPLFKYYIFSDLLILICVVLIQNIAQTNWDTVVGYTSIVFIMFIILPLSWIHGVWRCYRYNEDHPKNVVVKKLYNFSELITRNVVFRIVIYLLICMLCAGTVFYEMMPCEYFNSSNRTMSFFWLDFLYRVDVGEECIIPWHMTEACALIIIINFTFFRIHLWLKVAVAAAITITYSYFLWTFNGEYYKNSESYNHSVGGPVAHIVGIIYLTLTLHFMDRQTDYMNRLDYNWKVQLNMEQKEAHVLHDVNNKLLNNILPLHVAEYYMDEERQSGLYYEEYTEDQPVAVMFASIDNYDRDLSDKTLLTLLGGIITSFDQILLRSYDNVVEKIKIANWTYMAASGLDPGRRISFTEGKTSNQHVVISLLKFAVQIKKQIKKEFGHLQECKLRIGISHGAVTAGVVGSKKPLYDIWGDPVNMASRMESTGIMDCIQVTQDTAIIIQNHGYSCSYRGRIFVKGKSENVPTYFVDLDENDDLIKI